MDTRKSAQLRQLPAVDEVLQHPLLMEVLREFPHSLVADAVRLVVGEERQRILLAEEQPSGSSPSHGAPPILTDPADLVQAAVERLRADQRPLLRRLVNATGVILHTNLGRAVLAEEALAAVQAVGGAYSNLEYNLQTSQRGKRYDHVRGLLRRLSGAEDALVVNNNASAVLLCLQSLASGRQVVVSRGELVEIGGSFRIPEIMAQSGALLYEVGATNKTHLKDYERAIGTDTALLLKVHQSNFRIVGFTEEVEIADLVALGRRHDLPVMVDLGSGSFLPGLVGPLYDEPTVPEVVSADADLVCFSGDKLLGGPQAGILVGKRALIDRLQQHPLTRALRVDKFTLAALEATLRLYLDPQGAQQRIPTLRLLKLEIAELELLAKELCAQLRERLDARFTLDVVDEQSTPGGGALPAVELPTKAVALACAHLSPAAIDRRLHDWNPPIIARIRHDVVLFDVRTIFTADVPEIVEACASLATPESPHSDASA